MEVAERDGEAIFLHRVAPGASDHSYGVQVARMAGLPASVTERAAQLVHDGASPNPLTPFPWRRRGDHGGSDACLVRRVACRMATNHCERETCLARGRRDATVSAAIARHGGHSPLGHDASPQRPARGGII